MKREKLHLTWEMLNDILNLNGKKIYNVKIVDDGILLDLYGGEIEHSEGAVNIINHRHTFNKKEDIEIKQNYFDFANERFNQFSEKHKKDICTIPSVYEEFRINIQKAYEHKYGLYNTNINEVKEE